MSRWPPDARRRLRQAALELYASQGYDATTVQSIAAAAGLTERTFFRHFADKREVLHDDDARRVATLVDAVRLAPAGAAPRAAIAAGLDALVRDLEPRRAAERRRHRLIATHADLRERELATFAERTRALAAALVERDVPVEVADTAAAVAVALFGVAYRRWAGGRRATRLGDELQHAVNALASLDGRARLSSRPARPGSNRR